MSEAKSPKPGVLGREVKASPPAARERPRQHRLLPRPEPWGRLPCFAGGGRREQTGRLGSGFVPLRSLHGGRAGWPGPSQGLCCLGLGEKKWLAWVRPTGVCLVAEFGPGDLQTTSESPPCHPGSVLSPP